jgi:deoxyribodipyrimidine photolyase
LAFRDFYADLLAQLGLRDNVDGSGVRLRDPLPVGLAADADFEWTRGETGYPFVDGMRQLQHGLDARVRWRWVCSWSKTPIPWWRRFVHALPD